MTFRNQLHSRDAINDHEWMADHQQRSNGTASVGEDDGIRDGGVRDGRKMDWSFSLSLSETPTPDLCIYSRIYLRIFDKGGTQARPR